MIDGNPSISISIYPEITILNSEYVFDFTNEKNLQKLTNYSNMYFENLMKDYLYVITRKYNADIASFQGIYRSSFLTDDDFNKVNWNLNFQNSFYEVKTYTRISSSNLFNKE